MTDADILGLLTILLCIVGSMFFSASETAIMTFGERRAKRVIDEGGKGASALREWVHDPVRVLSTILVGNNIVNMLLGSVTTAITIRHLGQGEYSEYSVPIATGVSTLVLLLFGEVGPKAAGRLYAQSLTIPALTVLRVVGIILSPITRLLTWVTNAILHRTSAPGEQAAEFSRVTPDELDYLVDMGEKEGSIPENQAALLRGIFRFEDKVVRDIMVSRDRMTAIDLTWDVSRVFAVAHTSGHSRMPVYEGDLGHIKGVLHIKQLVGVNHPTRQMLLHMMRPPMFVSESLRIQDLMRRFKEQRVHLAVVVNDGGYTVGVVTLEDVLEQIVGKIFDETDVNPSSSTTIPPDAGVHILEGQASLTSLEELLDVDLGSYEGVNSIGDLLTQLAGQIPIEGSVFVCEDLRFKVLNADERHVIRVSVTPIETSNSSDD